MDASAAAVNPVKPYPPQCTNPSRKRAIDKDAEPHIGQRQDHSLEGSIVLEQVVPIHQARHRRTDQDP